jgi:hypothetical protein
MECFEEPARCQDADLIDVFLGERVLVAGDDRVSLRSHGGFDEAVVVGVADESDGLGGDDHDGREG